MTDSKNQGQPGHRRGSSADWIATTVVMGALVLIGAASASLGGTLFVPVGAVIGGLWGWGLALIAARITRRDSGRDIVARSVLFLTVFCTIMVAGASLMGQLLSTAAIDTQPQFFADMIRGRIGAAEALPFYALNTPIEWLLLPMAVLLSRKSSLARGLLLTALVLWTFHRTWTYLYFVPHIVHWSQGHSPFTPEERVLVRTWVDLSWVRQGFDDVVAALELASVFSRTTKIEARLTV